MPKIPRRQFTQSLGAAIVTTALPAKQLPIAFSTLGCPKWEWKKILANARDLGYAAMELRGILGEMDLTRVPEFNGERLKQSMADLAALDLRISDLGSSARMHESDSAKRSAQMDEGKRFIDLAAKMNAPYVRVFGDKYIEGSDRAATIERVSAGLHELGEYARGSRVTVVIESHGDFTDSATLLKILKAAASDRVALLWDAHHTFVTGKEQPADTFKVLGSYVRHVHLKDSKPDDKGEHHYVLTGTGSVPVKEQVRVLAAGGYQGFYCFEWEKVWHPEILEPEVSFPQYAKVMREYLAAAGVTG
jgi:sugar phosphate isomerase/epimerase